MSTVTDIAAIWGALTGTAAATFAAATTLRDRPSLRVVSKILTQSYKHRDPPALVVTVTNTGKQPVAINEIGLALGWRTTGRIRKRTYPKASRSLSYGEWPPPRDRPSEAPKGPSGFPYSPPAVQTVKPGDAITAWTWIEDTQGVTDVRAFATDVLGRVAWAAEISADEQRHAIEFNEREAWRYG